MIPTVFLPDVSWCMDPTARPHNMIVRMSAYYDFNTFQVNPTTGNKRLLRSVFFEKGLHSALSKLLLPGQTLQIPPISHYDLRKEMSIATLLWDSYATETTYKQTQDPHTGNVVTIARHRTYVDGAYLEQRMTDHLAAKSTTLEGGGNTNAADSNKSNRDEDEDVRTTISLQFFVVKNGDITLSFRDGTTTWLGLKCILILVSGGNNAIGEGGGSGSGSSEGPTFGEDEQRELESTTVSCLADAMFGVTPLRSGVRGDLSSKSASQVETHNVLLGSSRLNVDFSSQVIVDASLRNSILMRLDGTIGAIVQTVAQLDTFARNHMGYVGSLMYQKGDGEDINIVMPLHQDGVTENVIVVAEKGINDMLAKFVDMSFRHLEEEDTLLAAHKDATNMFTIGSQVYQDVSEGIRRAETTLNCCAIKFERKRRVSSHIGVMFIVVMMGAIACVAYLVFGVLMRCALLNAKRK